MQIVYKIVDKLIGVVFSTVAKCPRTRPTKKLDTNCSLILADGPFFPST